MDSIAFDLYSGRHGGFTFNCSLNFTSSHFSSRLFTYLLYFSLNVILFLNKPLGSYEKHVLLKHFNIETAKYDTIISTTCHFQNDVFSNILR